MPQVIAALAVRPGKKQVDTALLRGIQFLAGLFLFEYNSRHPDDPIRLRQDGDTKYLLSDKLFPPGWQPACTLKDGYLLIASSPDGIRQFRPGQRNVETGSETPLLRVAAAPLSKTLRLNRQAILDHLAAKNKIPVAGAARDFDNALSVLDLLDRVEIVHAGGAGQASFSLRILPANTK
jgi:hypothetical protein